MEKAAYLGVAHGVGDNRFAPDDALTREQAAVMLTRLVDVLYVHIEDVFVNPLPTQALTASGSDKFSSWAVDAIGRIQATGIMSSTSTTAYVFSPNDTYTREHSIVSILWLYRTLQTVVRSGLGNQDISNELLAAMVESGEIPENVKRLNLALNQITDITPLSRLTNLTELDLWGNEIVDLSPLSNLTSLTELILVGGRFEDISPLRNLTSLTTLILGSSHFNGDISILRDLTNLSYLALGDIWQEQTDFSTLEALVDLERLHLGGARELVNISFLENLTRLTELSISGANISDFAPLGNLVSLTSLDLQSNQISDISSLQLHNFPSLTVLRLFNNQITDISELSSLASLTDLTLMRNQISDISPLASLTNLEILWLNNNLISDVSPLMNLTSLTQLDLSGNQLYWEDVNELALALPNTRISLNGAIWPGDETSISLSFED